MNVGDQDLKHFKRLLLENKFEEAKKILAQNKGDFQKKLEVKIPSTLKDLPRDDFATVLIPDDVNRPRGQRLFALKATPNGDCLFNASSILVRGSLAQAFKIKQDGGHAFSTSLDQSSPESQMLQEYPVFHR